MLKKNPKERPNAKELLNNEIIIKKLKEYNLESEKQLILIQLSYLIHLYYCYYYL